MGVLLHGADLSLRAQIRLAHGIKILQKLFILFFLSGARLRGGESELERLRPRYACAIEHMELGPGSTPIGRDMESI